jgi:hypothetical protein
MRELVTVAPAVVVAACAALAFAAEQDIACKGTALGVERRPG